MQFGFLGIDYKNADLTIRDEISFTDQKKLEFFHKAEEIGVEQVMILSTCNRSEIYYFFDDEIQTKIDAIIGVVKLDEWLHHTSRQQYVYLRKRCD